MSALHPLLSAGLGLLWAGGVGAMPDQTQGEQVLAGRALYRGETRFATAPQLQGVALPEAACSQCHGLRGEAREEAGVRVPAIQWSLLLQGRDALAGYGDAARVQRAIVHGEGRQGQTLQAPMPQFQLTPPEQSALLAYLQVLGTDAEPVPGVTAHSVVVASVLPLSGPQASTGERVKAAMAARFDAINARGGVFGRQIDWHAIDGGASAASASVAASAALQEREPAIFALVGSLIPDPDKTLRQRLKVRGVPMVATLGVAQSEPTLPELTYLLPSLQVQLQELATELKRRCASSGGSAVLLHPAGDHSMAALGDALPQWRRQAVSAMMPVVMTEDPPESGPVIALLGREQMAGWRERMKASSRPGCLGTLAVLSGRPPPRSTERYTEAVALPMPPLVQDGAQPAGAALWTLLGDTAASVFAEALARSGRGLDAERFSLALDSLRHFQPVPGLSVTFGPRQRHGFDVTYLWRENPNEPLHTVP